MQLYLDSYGCFLSVKHGRFWLKTPNTEGQAIPILRLKCILLTKGVSLSSDAIFLALEHSIPIVFIDNLGRSEGYIWGGQFGSISSIRKKQAIFADHIKGLQWIKGILEERLNHQIQQLRQLAEAQPSLQKDYQKSWAQLQSLQKTWDKKKWLRQQDADALAASFRGLEGSASRIYFQAISMALPESWQFQKRNRRPAYDPFNALLNYLYGMLYPMVELSLIKAGLDPYMGILHVDRHRRPTFVYDMIELYRHWAEAVAINLVAEAQIDPQKHFAAPDPQIGIRLLSSGKSAVIQQMLEYLEAASPFMGKERKRSVQMDLRMQQIAQEIKQFRP